MKILTKRALQKLEHGIVFQEERAHYFKEEARCTRKKLKAQNEKLNALRLERDHLGRMLEETKAKIPETATFSKLYEIRLVELKKSFKLKPKPHYLEIKFKDGEVKKVEGSTNALEELATIIEESIDEDFIFIEERYFRRGSIVAFEYYEGHPTEYTEIEIEEWAHEKLNEEMESWEVVVVKKSIGINFPSFVTKAVDRWKQTKGGLH
jgi:hypothetical protein